MPGAGKEENETPQRYDSTPSLDSDSRDNFQITSTEAKRDALAVKPAERRPRRAVGPSTLASLASVPGSSRMARQRPPRSPAYNAETNAPVPNPTASRAQSRGVQQCKQNRTYSTACTKASPNAAGNLSGSVGWKERNS